MLLLLAILSFCAHVPVVKMSIDLEDCVWLYGGTGEDVGCDDGYVGVGACGSLGSVACNGAATGLQCCKMTGCKTINTNIDINQRQSSYLSLYQYDDF